LGGHLGASPVAIHKKYYKGEGGDDQNLVDLSTFFSFILFSLVAL
jgi:hypothetical protein